MGIIIESLLPFISDFGIEIALSFITILACIFTKSDKIKKLKKKLQKLKRKERKLAKKSSKTIHKEQKLEKEIEQCQKQ